jgi:8-oxo-dGTP pyrophosphatase MutT (NUDIX family)
MDSPSDRPTRDFTATTFVVDGDKTLLLWHRKMQAWLPPGGHIDPHELPDDAAAREVREETGLEVDLGGRSTMWGDVRVLHQPHCILLEDISPGHQHIDLVYFAHCRSPRSGVQIAAAEATNYRWFGVDDLETDDIAEDIRILGKRAIAEFSSHG